VGQQGSASGSLLLDLDGLEVVSAELVGGEWQLAVQTTAKVVGCAGCGVRATPHGRRAVRCATCRSAAAQSCCAGASGSGVAATLPARCGLGLSGWSESVCGRC
jgi:hypothetical protein